MSYFFDADVLDVIVSGAAVVLVFLEVWYICTAMGPEVDIDPEVPRSEQLQSM